MTQIKYAIIAHGRGTDRLLICRGKKSGRVGFLPDDVGENPFETALYAEKVVELPEPMTTTEYSEYIDSYPDDTPTLSSAMLEVSKGKGIAAPKLERIVEGGKEVAEA